MMSQTTLWRALKSLGRESDPFRPVEPPQQEEDNGPKFGASDNWLDPFDPDAEPSVKDKEKSSGSDPPVKMSSYVDKLGRVYPVDVFGNILRKTCRPFGVTTEQWKAASRKKKRSISRRLKGFPRASTSQKNGHL